MEESETSEVGEALYDFSFGIAGLERAYRTAVERLAFEAAAKCTHCYYPVVYFDAVSASVFHPDAKSVIVRDFLKSVRDLINEELGLRLEIEMTRYGGEYGRGGTVYGRIEQHMPDDEIVAQVGGILNARCGGIPDLALDFEGRYLLEWCLECIEIADSGNAEHCPEGDCAVALVPVSPDPSRGARTETSAPMSPEIRNYRRARSLSVRSKSPANSLSGSRYQSVDHTR